jgi:hypothetical protein|tara:strand:- start:300 stop:503 length:204 start_codon:yes stop_codon:yes gene_type:complete
MQHTVFILQLQGTGSNEKAWENAGVFTNELAAVNKLAEINAEYEDANMLVFTRGYNARIEERFLFNA